MAKQRERQKSRARLAAPLRPALATPRAKQHDSQGVDAGNTALGFREGGIPALSPTSAQDRWKRAASVYGTALRTASRSGRFSDAALESMQQSTGTALNVFEDSTPCRQLDHELAAAEMNSTPKQSAPGPSAPSPTTLSASPYATVNTPHQPKTLPPQSAVKSVHSAERMNGNLSRPPHVQTGWQTPRLHARGALEGRGAHAVLGRGSCSRAADIERELQDRLDDLRSTQGSCTPGTTCTLSRGSICEGGHDSELLREWNAENLMVLRHHG
eukprot:SAG31_NODE_458_length_15415_cov_3.647428_1_plen_271_part_00